MTIMVDVAVVGLGAAGSSALYQLARRGVRAMGIDRFNPPHDRGSSHGQSRITRQAIGEGQAYVPLVLRSNTIWETVEAATGQRLLERCGFLLIARHDDVTAHHGKSGFFARTVQAAQTFGIAHELLDAAALQARFPQFTGMVGDERAYYEPGGGFLRPEACIGAQLKLATDAGATVWTDCRVHAVEPAGDAVRLRTPRGDIVAGQAIVATGAFLPAMAPGDLARSVRVHRQTLHWFDVQDQRPWREGASPTFIWTHGLQPEEQFYGFPPIEGAVKVARETYGEAGDVEQWPVPVDETHGRLMAERYVAGRLAGLAPRPSRSQACYYTVTPDSDFVFHRDPSAPQIVWASPCSGHGFKHAAAVGEALVQEAIGEAPCADLNSFSSLRWDGQGDRA